jgi:tetratricopeptide (TPR) repeat protein
MPSGKMGFAVLNLHLPILRTTCSIIILLAILPALYRSYGIFRADRIVRSSKTAGSYSRAIQYDPSNATLWWHRGRLHHYSLQSFDITQAAGDYQRALSINPRLGEAWADLSDCYDHMNRYEEAEAALKKAFSVRRYSPQIRWQAGNFYLRRGNLPKMYECFQLASQYDPQKLDIAMDTSWKIDSEHEQILQKLIPDTLVANLKYLNFLVARGELDLARPVWQRCLNNALPADFEWKPSSAFSYIDHLLIRMRVSEALGVWKDVLRKTRPGLSDFRPAAKISGAAEIGSENLLWNGSFEHEILQGGFDWRYQDTEALRFRIDTANRMEGLKSLQMTFGGENIASTLLLQIAPIPEPGPHQVDFYLRTKGLTSDQMPYLVIQGYPEAEGASARSAFFPATTDWSKISVPFTANPGCKTVLLILLRDRSSKFDNRIKGSLWLDGFALR